MTSTLPPLRVGGKVTQQVLQQLPTPPPKNGLHIGARAQRRITGIPQQESKAKVEEKVDTARYRNSYKHNLCLDMLKDGFHMSYCELFNLMKQQREERDLLGPDSGLQDEPLLEEQAEKLDVLQEHLTGAESAQRRGKMDVVYQHLLTLAQYFEETKDTWLADHFYAKSLSTSLKVRGDSRRKEAEANSNMGLAQEKRGNVMGAIGYFEAYYKLTKGRVWQNDDGEDLHANSCEHLRRVYTTIAEQMNPSDPMEAIEYLLKAYDMAKEGGESAVEGLAGYRLGNAYEEIGDPETAILYHNGYLEKCQQNGDDVGMGMACQALAKAHEKQGDIDSAIKYLEMFVELAERAKHLEAQGKACSCLGAIYNSIGKYEEAAKYFQCAYEVARELNDPETIEVTRVQYGIAIAHSLLAGFAECLNDITRPNTERILSWKSSRIDSFTPEALQATLDTTKPTSTEDKEEESGSLGSNGDSGVSGDAPASEEQGVAEVDSGAVTEEEEPKEESQS